MDPDIDHQQVAAGINFAMKMAQMNIFRGKTHQGADPGAKQQEQYNQGKLGDARVDQTESEMAEQQGHGGHQQADQ